MHDLCSTFPLDERAIARSAAGKILSDPITWVPLLPVVAAYSIFDVPAPLAASLGGAVLGGLVFYWRGQWVSLTARLRQEMITEHNAAQNALLRQAAKKMRAGGAEKEADQMERLVLCKTQIEQRLHSRGALTEHKIQLERLIDSLCFGARDELCALTGLENRGEGDSREKIEGRVAAALTTLQATAGELDLILNPVEAPAGVSEAPLEEAVRLLREESELARRIQERLQWPGQEPGQKP